MTNTIALDKNHDTYLDVYGNIAIVKDAKSVSQNVVTAIKTWINECDFDQGKGIRYFDILGKPIDEMLIRDQLETTILAVDGVSEILSLDYKFDNSKRSLSIKIRYQLNTGEVINESF